MLQKMSTSTEHSSLLDSAPVHSDSKRFEDSPAALTPDRSSVGAFERDFQPDPYRWVVLVIFSFFIVTNAFQFIMFAPIVREMEMFFDISASQVNLMSGTYFIVYTVLVFLTCHFFENLGLKSSLLVGSSFNALGAVCRLVSVAFFPSYSMLVISQVLCALGQCLSQSVPPILASAWFPANERTLATAVGACAMNLGIATGLLIPPLLVLPPLAGEAVSRSEVLCLFAIIAGAAVVVQLCVLFFVPHKPESPPSASASNVGEVPLTFSDSLRFIRQLLWGNHGFSWLFISNCISIGFGWTLFSVYSQIFLVFGVSEAQSGVMGFLNIFCGTFCAFIVSKIVDRSRKYKFPLVLCFLGICVFLSVLYIIFTRMEEKKNSEGGGPSIRLIAIFICYTLIGLCQSTSLPIGLEFGVELSYPIPESLSSGMFMGGASIVSLIILLSVSAMLGTNPSQSDAENALILFIVVICLGGLAVIACIPELKRFAYEESVSPMLSPQHSVVFAGSATIQEEKPPKGAEH